VDLHNLLKCGFICGGNQACCVYGDSVPEIFCFCFCFVFNLNLKVFIYLMISHPCCSEIDGTKEN
jgi:hypothetical protein